MENGNFSWGEEDTVLKNINFSVDKGKLAAVVGTVGSGKSSLLSALLGEMEKVSGRVNTMGKIAYVSQVSFVKFTFFLQKRSYFYLSSKLLTFSIYSKPGSRTAPSKITFCLEKR